MNKLNCVGVPATGTQGLKIISKNTFTYEKNTGISRAGKSASNCILIVIVK